MSNTSLLDKLRGIVAAEPELVADTTALARRIRTEAGVISDGDVLDLLRRLRHDSLGLGVLEPILTQPGLSDVVVNGPRSCFIDRGSGLEPVPVSFASDAEVRQLATRLAAVAGVRLDDAQPFADGRLARPDGTALRLHALLAPPSAGGTCRSVRVLRQAQPSVDQLVASGSIAAEVEPLLRAIVERHASFLVIGGTGAGKTTLLSAMLGTVPDSERILVIEDTAELAPLHPHVVTLVARRANAEGRGEITMRDSRSGSCGLACRAQHRPRRRCWDPARELGLGGTSAHGGPRRARRFGSRRTALAAGGGGTRGACDGTAARGPVPGAHRAARRKPRGARAYLEHRYRQGARLRGLR